MKDAPYFPGRDYPNREAWLAKRSTPRKPRAGTVLYGAQPGGEPLRLGTNLGKRIEEKLIGRPGARFKKRNGGGVLQARHGYYDNTK
jgi:hypothetical protein